MPPDESLTLRDLVDCPPRELKPERMVLSADVPFENLIKNIWAKEDGWLLGHATDGVLWGRILHGALVLAHDADPTWGPALDPGTFLHARMFNADFEVRVWRSGSEWKACRIGQASGESGWKAYEESQILIAGQRLERKEVAVARPRSWFSRIIPWPSNPARSIIFSLLEGPAGQRQAVPADWDGAGQALRLKVRHYLAPDPTTGMFRAVENRMLGLEWVV